MPPIVYPKPKQPTVLEQREEQIAYARKRLYLCPDCRPKSLALTNLENAEIMLDEANYPATGEKRAEVAYQYLILAWGWERKISAS